MILPVHRVVAIIVLAGILLLTSAGGTPAGWATLPPDDGLLASDPPTVTATSWILYDSTFGKVLAEEVADKPVAVASTTKIVTALVVIERTRPDDLVSVSRRAAGIGGSRIGLIADEEPWTVEEMLAALMLRSANDAAIALAEHVGGSVAGFADMMNARASELGLGNSRFVNPHGLDHPDHYSSARDLLGLSIAAMELPRFFDLIQALSVNLPDTPEGDPRVALNRNELVVEYPGALGIKTGFTTNALQTLVAAAERRGRRIYAVVLGSTQHFEDAAALLDYGFTEFGPMTLVPATSDIGIPLAGGLDGTGEEGFELFMNGDQVGTLPEGRPEAGDEQPEPADIPEGSDTADRPLEEEPVDEEGPVVSIDQPVVRETQLPGMRDALVWFRRYWDWINQAT